MQPRRVKLDAAPRPCPGCGAPGGRLVRFDSYLSLFFIPLFPVRRGRPVIQCAACGGTFEPGPAPGPGVARQAAPSRSAPERCPVCGRKTAPDHHYCASCGQRLV